MFFLRLRLPSRNRRHKGKTCWMFFTLISLAMVYFCWPSQTSTEFEELIVLSGSENDGFRGRGLVGGDVPSMSSPSVSNNHNPTKNSINSKYNLMDEATVIGPYKSEDCSLDYINRKKLAQNHPCVIQMIRQNFIRDPSPYEVPYNLSDPARADANPSQADQPEIILEFLKNKTKGFFVDCGAHDGETFSNSLYMERTLNWNGLLIEANPNTFKQLLSRNRKSWALPVCLSLKPYPTQVSFQVTQKGYLDHIVDDSVSEAELLSEKPEPFDLVTVQCFPLYSILLAVNQPRVDYFSLDVEGRELEVLKTIPFHLIDIRTMSVEIASMDLLEVDKFLRFMRDSAGYLKVAEANIKGSGDCAVPLDYIFIKDLLNND